MDISRQFVHRATSLRIMSFVEQQAEWPLTTLACTAPSYHISTANLDQIVPESSAILDLPNEIVIPLNAHHRSMCRFPNIGDQNYVLVEAAIKEIVGGESQGGGNRFRRVSFHIKECTLTLPGTAINSALSSTWSRTRTSLLSKTSTAVESVEPQASPSSKTRQRMSLNVSKSAQAVSALVYRCCYRNKGLPAQVHSGKDLVDRLPPLKEKSRRPNLQCGRMRPALSQPQRVP